MKKKLLLLIALAALGLVVYVLIPSGEDRAQKLDRAEVGEAKEVAPTVLSGEGETIDLSAANTKIGFSCAKVIAGKILTMRGGWSEAFGSQIAGEAVVDRQNHRVAQIELQIDVGSLWSEHDQLTEALKTKGFFHVKKHPLATFVSTKIETVAEAADSDATHQIEGNFSLNGINKSIAFPAKIELSDSELRLQSQFSLRRKDYQVRFTDTAGFGLLTDQDISELVAMDITINATTKSDALAHSDTSPETSSETPKIDLADLPETYVETIPATQIQFEMVLVPGDPDHQVAPLYVGKYEVTWDEFMPWVDGRDLENIDSLGELRAMKLRPSPPYGSVDRGFGMDGRPALGMSRLSAMKYCQWLSKQTGKNYHLPTEKQWEQIYVAGGGALDGPPTAELAQRTTVYVDNSWNDDLEDWATKPVGTTEPNALGIYDLAGNVCEWVVDTGDQRVARGGHFDSDRDKLGVGRHVEGPYWNRDYPNEPKSLWWFVNARWVGFRLIREVPDYSENAPISKRLRHSDENLVR